VSKKKSSKASNAQIGDEPFDDQKLIRCWGNEKKAWDEAAKRNGESTSAWLRRVANRAAASDKRKSGSN